MSSSSSLSLITLFAINVTFFQYNTSHHVNKRALLFPQYTVLQFTYGISAPAILPNQTMVLSLCVQQNYEPPYNISQFYPTIISARNEDADLDKNTFYNYVINFLDSFGLNGRECLAKTVCEIAQIPMHIDDPRNVLEHIVHYLMTPSEEGGTNLTQVLEDEKRDVYATLVQAETLGRSDGACEYLFPDCDFSLADLFTKTFFV